MSNSSNEFYTPSGNPAIGSEGLSGLIRAEFVAISAAFSMLPQISTTGLFNTIFSQQGSYTFVLPDEPGTLALLTDVAAATAIETTRAEAAEGVLSGAIGTETARAEAAEAGLSWAIGNEADVRAGAIGTETTRAEAAEGVLSGAIGTETTRAEAAEGVIWGVIGTKVATGSNAALASLVTTGDLVADGGVFVAASTTVSGFYLAADGTIDWINWTSNGWKLVFGRDNTRLAQFNSVGNGLFSFDYAGNFWTAGTVSASNVSDARTKRAITPYKSGLAAVIGLEPISYQYNGKGGTTATGKTRWGVTAQQARQFLPECVYETPEPDADPTLDREPAKTRLPGQLSFDEQPLLYAMVNAFREVAAELLDVKARLAALEPR